MATNLPSHRKLNLPRIDGEPRSLHHPLSPHINPNKHKHVSNEKNHEQNHEDILPYSHPLSPHATCSEDDQSQCINEENILSHAPTNMSNGNVASHPLSPHETSLDQDERPHETHVASTISSSPSSSTTTTTRKMYTPSTSSTATPADLSLPATTSPPATKTILMINGPNLNLLGHREPQIYGHATLQDITTNLTTIAASHGIRLQHYQSNHEGQILDRIHACLLGQLPKALTSTDITHNQQQPSSLPPPLPQSSTEEHHLIKPDAIIINPGALTHTSIALRDALLGVAVPFVEVHISNVHTREAFRHTSYLSDKATAVIAGLGVFGYEAALRYWVGEWTSGQRRVSK